MHTFTIVEDDTGRTYFQVGCWAHGNGTWVILRECKTVGAALMWVNYLNGGQLPEKGITAIVDQISARWEHGT